MVNYPLLLLVGALWDLHFRSKNVHSLLNAIHVFFFSPYTLLFLLVVVEGPIATLIAAFLAAQGLLNVYFVGLDVICGDIVGDIGHYALGRWGRKGFIDRWGKYIGLTPKRLKRLDSHFDAHSGKTVLLSKLAHGVGSVFLVGAGMSRMPFKKYLAYSAGGTIPKSILLILIGFYFGQTIQQLRKYFHTVAIWSFIAAILLVIVYLLIVRYSRKAERKL